MAVAFSILVLVFAIAGVFHQWRKPRKTQHYFGFLESKTVLSALYVIFILFASLGGLLVAGGFICALADEPVYYGVAGFGVALTIVSVALIKYISKKLSVFDNSATEGSNYNFQKEPNAAPDYNKTYPADGEMNYDFLEDFYGENYLKYSYEHNFYLFGDGYMYLAGNGGKNLRFVQEPENPYDSNAVAIYLGANKLGYVYRNDGLQKMINDWIKRGEYFTGYLNKFSVADKKATFKIGFYKPLSVFPSKTFSLIRVNKKIDEFTSRADNLLDCDVGDPVKVTSYLSDTYIVLSEFYKEIGELPKSADKFLEECYDDDNIVGIIREIDDEYETAPKAKVEIYITK